MKYVNLKVARVIDGVVRQPAEGPIAVDDAVAEQIVADDAGEIASDGDDLPDDDDDGLDDETVADLKSLAELEGVDLGEATKKADIIAAIRARRVAA